MCLVVPIYSSPSAESVVTTAYPANQHLHELLQFEPPPPLFAPSLLTFLDFWWSLRCVFYPVGIAPEGLGCPGWCLGAAPLVHPLLTVAPWLSRLVGGRSKPSSLSGGRNIKGPRPGVMGKIRSLLVQAGFVQISFCHDRVATRSSSAMHQLLDRPACRCTRGPAGSNRKPQRQLP